jgi:integrase
VPKGLKPVQRRLATGDLRVYWYHRATGKRLLADPRTAEGMLEVRRLDDAAQTLKAAGAAATGSLAALWIAYADRGTPEWTGLKPRTRSDYQKVRLWLGAAAEKARVRSITSENVLALRDKAFKTKGRRFANYVVSVLHILLGWGKLRGWVEHNAAHGVPSIRRPTGARKVNRAWTPVEVAAFAAAAPTQLLVPFALGLFAGMRQGDALIVTWSAVTAGRLEWIAGKNGEECEAPITDPLRLVLSEARAARGDALQIAVNSYGEPWSQSGFRASFFKLVRRLVAEGKLKPGCTFHGLRHTIGAHASNDGHSDRRVAAAIGDRSPAMAQIYARDADRRSAQTVILEAAQKRFANIDWSQSPEAKTARLTDARLHKDRDSKG